MSKPRIAILASGAGTTAEVVMKAAASGELNAEIVCIVANRKTAGVFERVKNCNATYGTSTAMHYISSKNFPPSEQESWEAGTQTSAEETAILEVLQQNSIDFVLLLGYMKLVGPRIVEVYGYTLVDSSPYTARMLNTHPGLLPATKGYYGIHVQEFVLENNLSAGHCLFAVDAEYDGGPVVATHTVEVMRNDTPETLFRRVQESERATIAADIAQFLRKYNDIAEENNGR